MQMCLKKRNASFEASGQRCYRWRGDAYIIARYANIVKWGKKGQKCSA